MPYRASSVLLAYNPDKVPNPPKTLDEVLAWIKANPGRFTYNSPKTGGSGGAFVATVLDKTCPQADRDQMTTGYHKELEKSWDPGWQELPSLNPSVFQKGVYPNGNNQTLQLLSSGQIDMAPVWSDQFISGQASGSIPKNFKAQQISNPSFTGGASYLGVTKGVEEPGPRLEVRRLHAPARGAGQDRRQDRRVPRHPADASCRARYRRSSRAPTPRTCGPVTTATTAPTSTTSGTRTSPASEQGTSRHRLGGLALASPPLVLVAVFVGFPIIVAVAYSLGHTGGLNATVAAYRQGPGHGRRSRGR